MIPPHAMIQSVPLVLFALRELIKHEPEIVAEIKALLSKAEPTDADFDALHAKVESGSYRKFVPATALPAATPAPAVVPAVVPITVLPPAESQPGESHRTQSLTPIEDASEHRTQSIPVPGPVTPGPVTPDITATMQAASSSGAQLLADIAATLQKLVAALPKQ